MKVYQDREPKPQGKHCGKCDTYKLISEFSGKWIEGKRISWRWNGAAYCKSCMRVRASDHYHSSKNQNNLNDRKVFNKTTVFQYLLDHPCVDCGETNPVVLEFDHVRGKKKFSISSGMVKGYTWSVLLDEIEKCDVRCANCHRIKTAKDFNWFSYQMHMEMTE